MSLRQVLSVCVATLMKWMTNSFIWNKKDTYFLYPWSQWNLDLSVIRTFFTENAPGFLTGFAFNNTRFLKVLAFGLKVALFISNQPLALKINISFWGLNKFYNMHTWTLILTFLQCNFTINKRHQMQNITFGLFLAMLGTKNSCQTWKKTIKKDSRRPRVAKDALEPPSVAGARYIAS